MLYLPSICYTIPSKGKHRPTSDRREHAMTDITANEFNAPIYSLIEMAEQKAADMREMAANADYIAACEYLMEAEAYEAGQWERVVGADVVEDTYKETRDFEHFEI